MNILHVGNWCSGVHARNVRSLKQWSKHQHEFVARCQHPYDLGYEAADYTRSNTTRELVLRLAEEADALEFHAVGYDGTAELPETIHGIDWARFRGKKRLILHGTCSMLAPDGSWFKPCGRKFDVRNLDHYDLLLGPALSCKFTYDQRLEYVPDIIPINDWLYTPQRGEKPERACSFKGWERAEELQFAGIDFELLKTPTKMPIQLDYRRRNFKATLDNFTDGHWGLFGLESLSQGIPCCVYTHPMNRECWDLIKAKEPPPFVEIEYGGKDLAAKLRWLLAMRHDEWEGWSQMCRRWIERFYDPEILVWRWDSVYDSIA